jgi:cation transport ATPase
MVYPIISCFSSTNISHTGSFVIYPLDGESVPIDKKVGDEVIGGTINKNGYLQFKEIHVANHTVLAIIFEMVKRARLSKAPICH